MCRPGGGAGRGQRNRGREMKVTARGLKELLTATRFPTHPAWPEMSSWAKMKRRKRRKGMRRKGRRRRRRRRKAGKMEKEKLMCMVRARATLGMLVAVGCRV